jgi:diguanylate cyclase (GGDEF)-like protein
MNTLWDTFADLRRQLREPPDTVMQDIGASGEVLWAQLRRLICAILMIMPLINAVTGGSAAETAIGLVFTGAALLASHGFLVLARQHRRLTWLPFVSAMYDISTISGMLLLLAWNEPAAGLNSMVVWACYPLAMLSSTLRNDVRVTLFAGVLAIGQFGAIVAWYLLGKHAPPISAIYGTVTWANELERLVLLLASALLCATLALRMQKMVLISGTDGLTGLPNRSYLNLRLPGLITDARAGDHSLCLALIDLDHFKRINEEFGYLVGDRALRHTAETLRLELKRSEALIRVGGEEFVLILDQPIGSAWEYLDLLRRKLAARPFETEPGMVPRTITFSAGLAACPQDAVELSGLLRCADRRLRAAKLAGRNRVAARDETCP